MKTNVKIRKQKLGLEHILLGFLALFMSPGMQCQSASYTDNINPVYNVGTTFDNCGFGISAINNSGSGSGNTATGHFVLTSNSTGEYNTGTGWSSLNQNDAGNANTACGYSTLYSNCSGAGNQGESNVALGYSTLFSNTDGDENTSNGSWSLYSNIIGANNTATGHKALYNNSPSTSSTGQYNTANGDSSLYENDDGYENTADGKGSMALNYSGYANAAAGYLALRGSAGSQGSCYYNTVIGSQAMLHGINSNENTAVGSKALFLNFYGSNNCANGFQALYSNCGAFGGFYDDNVAMGGNALYDNKTGKDNVAIGYAALYNNDLTSITNENSSTAVGMNALFFNYGHLRNTGVGYQALVYNLSSAGNAYTDNTMVGAYADMTTEVYNSGAVGYMARVDSVNKIRIGNANVSYYESPCATSTSSDGRFKHNISESDVKGLAFINKLRPVVYNFDTKKYAEHLIADVPDSIKKRYPTIDYSASSSIRHTGFIAQEVEKAAKEVGYDFSGIEVALSEKTHYGLAYDQFVVPLVKAVQEQQVTIKKMKMFEDSLIERAMLRQIEIDNLMKGEQETESYFLTTNAPNGFTVNAGQEISGNAVEVDIVSISNEIKPTAIVHDLTGKQLDVVTLFSKKDGHLHAKTKELSGGLYLLSILVENELVVSKHVAITSKR